MGNYIVNKIVYVSDIFFLQIFIYRLKKNTFNYKNDN